jgi:hypothetical protein
MQLQSQVPRLLALWPSLATDYGQIIAVDTSVAN